MRHWEKTAKKDPRRHSDESFQASANAHQDHKKKKLKPVEKMKYRIRGAAEEEEE